MHGSQNALMTLNPDAAELDAALRRLHNTEESAELSLIHQKAAEMMEQSEAKRFHLTHAWVHALVSGNTNLIKDLEGHLKSLGAL